MKKNTNMQNNSNILCLGGKCTGPFEALDIFTGRGNPARLDAIGNIFYLSTRQEGFIDRNHIMINPI